MDDGGGFGWLGEERDDFQLLQRSSGVEEDAWHEVGAELETDDTLRFFRRWACEE